MNKICTDIEQSKKLIELGIDRKTADMSYSSFHNIDQEVAYCNIPLCICPMADDIPAWGLSALLKLMPTFTEPTAFGVKVSVPKLVKENNWVCKYEGDFDIYFNTETENTAKVFFEGKEPIDAAFEMVCWLKENNKI